MKLHELPLIMEAFHQIQADKGQHPESKTWYINRYAEIPPEWQEEFLLIERTLAKVSGLRLEVLFPKATDRPRWLGTTDDVEYNVMDLALMPVINCVDDSATEIMAAAGIPQELGEVVQSMLNTFFDGGPEGRHGHMQDLFVTYKYSY